MIGLDSTATKKKPRILANAGLFLGWVNRSGRGGDRLGLGGGGQHVGMEAATLAVAPPKHDRRGDEDRREGADDDADEDDDAEITQAGTAEEGEDGHTDQGGSRGQQGAGQGGVDRLVHDLFHRTATDEQRLTDPVEDDDGVVDGVTGDGQHRADVDQRKLATHQDDDARHR